MRTIGHRLLCLFFISCLLTPGYESSNSNGSSAINNKEWIDGVIAVVTDQPIKEVQRKPFRIQPKLYINTTAYNVSYYVTATLRYNENFTSDSNNSSRSLMGDDTLKFINNWANFTNLAISLYGQQYLLEFLIYSSDDNVSSETTVFSRPFVVSEFPYNVSMSILEPSQSSQKSYSVAIILILWDFTINALAQINTMNDTVWHYSISLRQNESSSDIIHGEINGTFPPKSHRTPIHHFNLTNIGYRYQFQVTMSSPSFITTLTNISDPFDVLWKLPVNDFKQSIIVLTFNGSYKDISGVEDKFCTIFLNHFGRLHFNVLWRNYTLKLASAEELQIEVTLAGKTKSVLETTNDVLKNVEECHQMNFSNQAFILKNKLMVDGVSYPSPNSEILSLFGLPVTSVFTIFLMSFLCSSFVVLVIIWKIREKKILEAYTRRMKTRTGRQNGHINTAFDSNESVPDRNVYYTSGHGRDRHDRHNQARRESGYNYDRESRLRRCSSGGFHRNYRKMRRLGSDEGDMYVGNGIPLDDELVFTDADKQDDVFRDVYFSPTSEGMPTFASSSSSFHDEYLLKDVHPHSGRANYAHIPTHKYKGSKRKCSVTASTVSGSLNSLATNSQSASRILSNSTIDSFSLHRPPLGWSSHDDNKLCNGNGSRGLVYYQY
ncbi:hypothetical protein CHUAL_013618 [Chamberlinius hualienensis]